MPAQVGQVGTVLACLKLKVSLGDQLIALGDCKNPFLHGIFQSDLGKSDQAFIPGATAAFFFGFAALVHQMSDGDKVNTGYGHKKLLLRGSILGSIQLGKFF
ncbi:MAG: hypothetical protein ACOY9Y_00770 [Bacillota bacterium]